MVFGLFESKTVVDAETDKRLRDGISRLGVDPDKVYTFAEKIYKMHLALSK